MQLMVYHNYEGELQTVTTFQKDDFYEVTLKVQLELFTTAFSQTK